MSQQPQSKLKKCDICRGPIEPVGDWYSGHNAEPIIPNGRCCTVCNDTVVIPTRIRRMTMRKSTTR